MQHLPAWRDGEAPYGVIRATWFEPDLSPVKGGTNRLDVSVPGIPRSIAIPHMEEWQAPCKERNVWAGGSKTTDGEAEESGDNSVPRHRNKESLPANKKTKPHLRSTALPSPSPPSWYIRGPVLTSECRTNGSNNRQPRPPNSPRHQRKTSAKYTSSTPVDGRVFSHQHRTHLGRHVHRQSFIRKALERPKCFVFLHPQRELHLGNKRSERDTEKKPA